MTQIEREGTVYYVCPACQLVYRERQWAEKCEAFCTSYNACSVEITEHAVPVAEER